MSYGRRGRRDASSRSSSPYKLQNCKLKVKYASLQSARARAINTPPKSRDYTLSSITLADSSEFIRPKNATREAPSPSQFVCWIRLFPKEDPFSCLFARLLASLLSENHRLLHLTVRPCEELN